MAAVVPPSGPLGYAGKARVTPDVLGKYLYIANKKYRLLRPGAPVYKTNRLSFEQLQSIGFGLNDVTIFGREMDQPAANGDTYSDFLWVLFSADDKELKPIGKELLTKLVDQAKAQGFEEPPGNRQTVALDDGSEVKIPVFPDLSNTTFVKKTALKNSKEKEVMATAAQIPDKKDKPPAKKQKVHKIRSMAAVLKDCENYFKTGLLTATLMQQGLETHEETAKLLTSGNTLPAGTAAVANGGAGPSTAAAPAAAPTKGKKKAGSAPGPAPAPPPTTQPAPAPAVVQNGPTVTTTTIMTVPAPSPTRAPAPVGSRVMGEAAFNELMSLAFKCQRNNISIGANLLAFIDTNSP
jgi:hypothetical protein